jgi:hypothetical protein
MSKTRQRKKQKIRDNLLKFYNKHTQAGSPIQGQKIFKSIGQNKIEELNMPVIADQPYVVYKTKLGALNIRIHKTMDTMMRTLNKFGLDKNWSEYILCKETGEVVERKTN